MFGTLIESSATPERRGRGTLASLLAHGAVVTLAVIATAKDATVAAPVPLVMHVVHFTPPVDPPPAPTRAALVASASVAAMPFVPRLSAPQIVPVGIPPVDLGVVPTVTGYDAGPIGRGIGCPLGECASGPVIDGDRMLLSASDILMRLREDPVPPRYPESLRRAGIEGDAVVRFTVDTTGRVDLGSVEVMSATHDAFVAPVRETLARLRFIPSMNGERKMKALAVMPFKFRLR